MSRRGAVLLELLVALAIFVVAATTLLATFGDVIASLDRGAVQSRAVDLARTRMSEIEAGLVATEDLRSEGRSRPAAAGGGSSRDRGEVRDPDGLFVETSVTMNEFPNLSLVEIRVYDGVRSAARFTLRQLVELPRQRSAADLGDDSEVERAP